MDPNYASPPGGWPVGSVVPIPPEVVEEIFAKFRNGQYRFIYRDNNGNQQDLRDDLNFIYERLVQVEERTRLLSLGNPDDMKVPILRAMRNAVIADDRVKYVGPYVKDVYLSTSSRTIYCLHRWLETTHARLDSCYFTLASQHLEHVEEMERRANEREDTQLWEATFSTD